jgi:hypothetical protein
MQRVDVASLELCRELYDLSDWEETGLAYVSLTTGEQHVIATDYQTPGENWDFDWAYDLSYLLRKLPYKVRDQYQAWVFGFKLMPTASTGWKIWYGEVGTATEMYFKSGDTPEDAAAKLCIELFRQNILKRDDGATDAK